MNTEEKMKPENQVKVGNLATMSKEELRELSHEEMKQKEVTLTELMGINKQREKELDALLHKMVKDDDFGGERVDQVLTHVKEREDLTTDEKIYLTYAFGSIQGKMRSQRNPMNMLHELLG